VYDSGSYCDGDESDVSTRMHVSQLRYQASALDSVREAIDSEKSTSQTRSQ
jgi:hypothetical protein